MNENKRNWIVRHDNHEKRNMKKEAVSIKRRNHFPRANQKLADESNQIATNLSSVDGQTLSIKPLQPPDLRFLDPDAWPSFSDVSTTLEEAEGDTTSVRDTAYSQKNVYSGPVCQRATKLAEDCENHCAKEPSNQFDATHTTVGQCESNHITTLVDPSGLFSTAKGFVCSGGQPHQLENDMASQVQSHQHKTDDNGFNEKKIVEELVPANTAEEFKNDQFKHVVVDSTTDKTYDQFPNLTAVQERIMTELKVPYSQIEPGTLKPLNQMEKTGTKFSIDKKIEEVTNKLLKTMDVEGTMDRLKLMINNPDIKYENVLKAHATKRIRLKMQKQLKNFKIPENNENLLDPDESIEEDKIPDSVLSEIDRVLDLNMFDNNESDYEVYKENLEVSKGTDKLVNPDDIFLKAAKLLTEYPVEPTAELSLENMRLVGTTDTTQNYEVSNNNKKVSGGINPRKILASSKEKDSFVDINEIPLVDIPLPVSIPQSKSQETLAQESPVKIKFSFNRKDRLSKIPPKLSLTKVTPSYKEPKLIKLGPQENLINKSKLQVLSEALSGKANTLLSKPRSPPPESNKTVNVRKRLRVPKYFEQVHVKYGNNGVAFTTTDSGLSLCPSDSSEKKTVPENTEQFEPNCSPILIFPEDKSESNLRLKLDLKSKLINLDVIKAGQIFSHKSKDQNRADLLQSYRHTNDKTIINTNASETENSQLITPLCVPDVENYMVADNFDEPLEWCHNKKTRLSANIFIENSESQSLQSPNIHSLLSFEEKQISNVDVKPITPVLKPAISSVTNFDSAKLTCFVGTRMIYDQLVKSDHQLVQNDVAAPIHPRSDILCRNRLQSEHLYRIIEMADIGQEEELKNIIEEVNESDSPGTDNFINEIIKRDNEVKETLVKGILDDIAQLENEEIRQPSIRGYERIISEVSECNKISEQFPHRNLVYSPNREVQDLSHKLCELPKKRQSDALNVPASSKQFPLTSPIIIQKNELSPKKCSAMLKEIPSQTHQVLQSKNEAVSTCTINTQMNVSSIKETEEVQLPIEEHALRNKHPTKFTENFTEVTCIQNCDTIVTEDLQSSSSEHMSLPNMRCSENRNKNQLTSKIPLQQKRKQVKKGKDNIQTTKKDLEPFDMSNAKTSATYVCFSESPALQLTENCTPIVTHSENSNNSIRQYLEDAFEEMAAKPTDTSKSPSDISHKEKSRELDNLSIFNHTDTWAQENQRLWRSPGEKKCIDLKSNTNDFIKLPLSSSNDHQKVYERIKTKTFNRMKEIDIELIALQDQRMSIDATILKLQTEKMHLDQTTIQLQTERFELLGSLIASTSRDSSAEIKSFVSPALVDKSKVKQVHILSHEVQKLLQNARESLIDLPKSSKQEKLHHKNPSRRPNKILRKSLALKHKENKSDGIVEVRCDQLREEKVQSGKRSFDSSNEGCDISHPPSISNSNLHLHKTPIKTSCPLRTETHCEKSEALSTYPTVLTSSPDSAATSIPHTLVNVQDDIIVEQSPLAPLTTRLSPSIFGSSVEKSELKIQKNKSDSLGSNQKLLSDIYSSTMVAKKIISDEIGQIDSSASVPNLKKGTHLKTKIVRRTKKQNQANSQSKTNKKNPIFPQQYTELNFQNLTNTDIIDAFEVASRNPITPIPGYDLADRKLNFTIPPIGHKWYCDEISRGNNESAITSKECKIVLQKIDIQSFLNKPLLDSNVQSGLTISLPNSPNNENSTMQVSSQAPTTVEGAIESVPETLKLER